MPSTTSGSPVSRETLAFPPDPSAVEPALPTERHAAPDLVRSARPALPESLDMEVQCAVRLLADSGTRYGTVVRLFAEGLSLVAHEAPPVGALIELEIDLDDVNLVKIEAIVIGVRRAGPAAPARVTVRWATLRPLALGRLAAWVELRERAEDERLRVQVGARPLPAIRRGPHDPTVAVTELGDTPRRGWIAALRQRVRGVRPEVRGPARPPFRGVVAPLSDGVSLMVAWSAEAAWRSDWMHYLADGQLPIPPSVDGAERRRVVLRLPDGRQREAEATPLRSDLLSVRMIHAERVRSVSTASR